MKCKDCQNYYGDEEKIPGGGTGWCVKPRLGASKMRCNKEGWCSDFKEREVLVKEDRVDGAGDNDNREQRLGRHARPLHSYQERVEMGGAEIVLRWYDDHQEISIGIYLNGAKEPSAELVAKVPSSGSRRYGYTVRD